MTFVREVSALAGATLDCGCCLCCSAASNVTGVCFLLQEENSALASENESQREQYERCLDEVSAHLVYLHSFQAAFEDAARLSRRSARLENVHRVFTDFVLTE